MSCNTLYDCPFVDWDYVCNFTKSCKYKFIISVDLFNEFFKESYTKRYEGSGKNVKHNIDTNLIKKTSNWKFLTLLPKIRLVY